MTEVFKFSRKANGETKREFVILSSNFNRDFLQVLHNVAVDYCLNNENRHPCKEDGMSFGQIMEFITPEMLEPYGVTMIRPEDVAIQADQMLPLVTRYELETIREVRRAERRRKRELKDYVERAVKRLETQRANQHPGVSDWGPEKVAVKAVSWTCQFMLSEEKNFAKFFEKKLKETLPKDPDEDNVSELTT